MDAERFAEFSTRVETSLDEWIPHVFVIAASHAAAKDAVCSKEPSGHDGMWKDLCPLISATCDMVVTKATVVDEGSTNLYNVVGG